MMSKPDVLAWLQQRTEDYRARKMGPSEVIENFDDIRKLGYGFRCTRYNNTLKCAFGVSTGRFLGFVVHEKGIEIVRR
jgi:hypothetical protein